VPEDSGVNYPLLGFLLLACPLRLLPSSYTFSSFSSAASTIDTSFRPHLLFTRYHLPIKCRSDFNHGWTEKEGQAKGRWPLPAMLSPGIWRIIFIVGKYSSSTYTQQPDSSWTSKSNPRSPLTSPTRTSAKTNKESHQPSFAVTVPAQDLVTTREESFRELQRIQREFELHR
jgi:hypothetical protein